MDLNTRPRAVRHAQAGCRGGVECPGNAPHPPRIPDLSTASALVGHPHEAAVAVLFQHGQEVGLIRLRIRTELAVLVLLVEEHTGSRELVVESDQVPELGDEKLLTHVVQGDP